MSIKTFSAVCLVLAGAIIFISDWAATPELDAVNGTYYNRCCGNIVLRNGSLFYKGSRYSYKLKNMKFGLTAYVPGDLTERGIRPSADDTSLRFFDSKGDCGFNTAVQGYDRSFSKIRRSNSAPNCILPTVSR